MKGFFSQLVVILLRAPVEISEIQSLLGEYGPHWEKPASDRWQFSGPSLVVPLRREVNGYIAIDVVDQVWPDHMGDPKDESDLFGAWSMGYFGPFTFPGGLSRAAQQAWHWQEAGSIASQHSAYLRLKASYCFGVESDAPVLPADYDPSWEILELHRRVQPLLSHRSSLCYFNPNGEVLLSAEAFSDALRWYEETGVPPLNIYSNVRMYNIGGEPRPWTLMDSVGMWQLDVPDHSAAFETDRYDPSDVADFIRNAGLYILENGAVVKDGDTMDGPGGIRWQGKQFNTSLLEPPRHVFRWLPMDGSTPGEALLREGDGA